MSRMGKWLLENSDISNYGISIDLQARADEIRSKGWMFARVKTVAVMLGITIIGGS